MCRCRLRQLSTDLIFRAKSGVPKEAKVNKNCVVTVGVSCGNNGRSCTTEVLAGNESAFYYFVLTAALDLTDGFLVINDPSGAVYFS